VQGAPGNLANEPAMEGRGMPERSLAGQLLKRTILRALDSRPVREFKRTGSGRTGMNILVVHPQYPGKSDIRYIPLGLAMVSAVAEREGHDVEVLDLLNQALPYSALDKQLKRRRYGLVMAGGFAMQVASMREIVQRVRRLSPGTKVLLGGVGVSDIPEIALDYTGADAVCTHEAELVLPDILRAVQDGRSFDDCLGIVFRAGDKVVRRPGGSIAEKLEDLPYPAYHLFDIDGIAPHSYNGWGAKKSIHITSSRGCPFRCTFCINSLLNDREYKTASFGGDLGGSKKPLRHRSPESVVKEIEFIKDRYGITDFHFADEEFITHTDHLLKMCAALKKVNVTWSTSGRADWVSEVKLAAMKEAGCRYIIFGIESGSQKIVDLMAKKAKVPRVAEGLVACYKVGMRFIPNFMIGYPGETRETIAESVEFCKALKLPYEPAFVTPFPNSRMFHDKKDSMGDWETYFSRLANVDYNASVFAELSDLSADELQSLRQWAREECAPTAASIYNVDYSDKVAKKRWVDLPPVSGPPISELPAYFRKRGEKLARTDGFAESLTDLEA
jgi:anaerobic magnesium-protoporphyrin IX monomethyl ester cyclase